MQMHGNKFRQMKPRAKRRSASPIKATGPVVRTVPKRLPGCASENWHRLALAVALLVSTYTRCRCRHTDETVSAASATAAQLSVLTASMRKLSTLLCCHTLVIQKEQMHTA